MMTTMTLMKDMVIVVMLLNVSLKNGDLPLKALCHKVEGGGDGDDEFHL